MARRWPSCVIGAFLLQLLFHERCAAAGVSEGTHGACGWIVVFMDHHPQQMHARILESIVRTRSGWTLCERSNRASSIPSDFSVLGVSDSSLLRRLETSKSVRSVARNRQLARRAPSALRHGRRLRNLAAMQGRHNPGRRRLNSIGAIEGKPASQLCDAKRVWELGYTGRGVRVAIFDTGLREDHPHVRNVRECSDWTGDATCADGFGHGTAVAGVISSAEPACAGLAPDAEIFIHRVFTDAQVSYTSWFLDAFNWVIHSKVHILNLSVGGPDFLDQPFVDKVRELSANGITVVSAIGNDGPLFGTLNNPADQPDVVGVGGFIPGASTVAQFSSRGMTTWELPSGYGRQKPDLVSVAHGIYASGVDGGCRVIGGTSIASPVVAGALALVASVLISAVHENHAHSRINPASLKQAVVETAVQLSGSSLFEQGAGRLNVAAAARWMLRKERPRASFVPPEINATDPYTWPYSEQPLYPGAVPIILNVTILNAMGVIGRIVGEPWWEAGTDGEHINVHFTFEEILYPWSGWIAVHVTAVTAPSAARKVEARGCVHLLVESPPELGSSVPQRSRLRLPLSFRIIPTPPRKRRVLWDQAHSIAYPTAYAPRDDLRVRADVLDWNGDHVHTNFRDLFRYLRSWGFFVEVLGRGFAEFDASKYAVLFIVDPEATFSAEEAAKLQADVRGLGLSLVVMADWYSPPLLKQAEFFDQGTRSWWLPLTGGANVPALNTLLHNFSVAFGTSEVYQGRYRIGSSPAMAFASGVPIVKCPAGSLVVRASGLERVLPAAGTTKYPSMVPTLGLVRVGGDGGRLVLMGDSNCVDSSHATAPCWWLLKRIMRFAADGLLDRELERASTIV